MEFFVVQTFKPVMLCRSCFTGHALNAIFRRHALQVMLCRSCFAGHTLKAILSRSCFAGHDLKAILCRSCFEGLLCRSCFVCYAFHALKVMLCRSCSADHALHIMLCMSCLSCFVVHVFVSVSCWACHKKIPFHKKKQKNCLNLCHMEVLMAINMRWYIKYFLHFWVISLYSITYVWVATLFTNRIQTNQF